MGSKYKGTSELYEVYEKEVRYVAEDKEVSVSEDRVESIADELVEDDWLNIQISEILSDEGIEQTAESEAKLVGEGEDEWLNEKVYEVISEKIKG